MITEKDFIRCGSPLGEFELHVTREQKMELLKRDMVCDKLLEFANNESGVTGDLALQELANIIGELE